MRLEEHAIAVHIENSQTEAMARELTVVEKGPPHPNSASARAHELDRADVVFPRPRRPVLPGSAPKGQLLGGQPTKRFRDGLYEELFIGASPFIALISD